MSQSESNPAADAATQEPEGNRAELRRAAFLKAARDVFLEHGYEAANMAEIVRRAGGSLSTLYAQFGGKRGLFLAMVETRVTELTERMQMELAAHAPLREGLQRIGEHVMSKMLDIESLDVTRVMIGQAKKFPDMSAEYMKLGPEKVRKALADYLEDRAEAGEIKLSNYDTAAAVFMDLIRARLHLRALLDPAYRATPEDIHDAVERGVKVFMGGVESL